MVKTKPIVVYNGELSITLLPRTSSTIIALEFSCFFLNPSPSSPKRQEQKYSQISSPVTTTENGTIELSMFLKYDFGRAHLLISADMMLGRSLPLRSGSSRAILPQDNRHGINNQNFSLARKCIHFSRPMTSYVDPIIIIIRHLHSRHIPRINLRGLFISSTPTPLRLFASLA